MDWRKSTWSGTGAQSDCVEVKTETRRRYW